MQKTCCICGHNIKDEEEVLVGMRAIYKEIPSRVSFAIQPTEHYVFINHYNCEMEEDAMDMPPEDEENG